MQRARSPLTLADVDGLAWEKGAAGLLPAVVQHAATLQILMLAWMDRAALVETLESGEATFFSRSRGTRWRKGETSGNRLAVQQLLADCDGDAILVSVLPTGPACHEGSVSCFGADDAPGVGWLSKLEQTIAERAESDPEQSYTARLLQEGVSRTAQKVGEEAVETVIASLTGPDSALSDEAADLLYHLLVLLRARGMRLEQVLETMRRRGA
jgi:phosphoribosyl-ATP pyrophosphohydrolase/phosphoribosyl-AMP cyclohydrolase